MGRTIHVYTRPVCEVSQCRKTAVVSHDGVWLCELHRRTAEVVKYATIGVPIVWER